MKKLNGTLPIQLEGCSRLKYTDFSDNVLNHGFEQASNILPKYGGTGMARFVKLFIGPHAALMDFAWIEDQIKLKSLYILSCGGCLNMKIKSKSLTKQDIHVLEYIIPT